jgi:hypothetical protein
MNRRKNKNLIKSDGGFRPDEVRQPAFSDEAARCQFLRREPRDEGRKLIFPGISTISGLFALASSLTEDLKLKNE